MAISIDSDDTPYPDFHYDPFVAKAQAAERHRQRLLEKFYEIRANGRGDLRDTTMVYLVLECQLHLTDEQYMKVLGLNLELPACQNLYGAILGETRFVADHLNRLVMARSLLQMPLTDVRMLCYRIAQKFEATFFVPGRSSDSSSAVDFEWLDRFNSMWPLVSLLDREYRAHQRANGDMYFVS